MKTFGIFDYMKKYQYENIFLCQDDKADFKAVIAIHSTALGPAAGGIRMWQYESEMDAIEDALRLARGMTYKYAAAGVNMGGGKAVVIADPKRKDREVVFRTLGRFINRLGGKFFTGEDVGTTLEDVYTAFVEVVEPLAGAQHLGPRALGIIEPHRREV